MYQAVDQHQTGIPTSQAWRRPANCVDSQCIEVAISGNDVVLRDSGRPGSPPLVVSREDFLVFTDAVKRGEFDLNAVRPAFEAMPISSSGA